MNIKYHLIEVCTEIFQIIPPRTTMSGSLSLVLYICLKAHVCVFFCPKVWVGWCPINRHIVLSVTITPTVVTLTVNTFNLFIEIELWCPLWSVDSWHVQLFSVIYLIVIDDPLGAMFAMVVNVDLFILK